LPAGATTDGGGAAAGASTGAGAGDAGALSPVRSRAFKEVTCGNCFSPCSSIGF
jgi:hypothetical protein